jgi:hypothetical protein
MYARIINRYIVDCLIPSMCRVSVVSWLMLNSLLQPVHSAELTGTITGRLCFPSEYIPEMTIYARNVKTGKPFSTHVKEGTAVYKILVPPGTYFVFVWTRPDEISRRSGGLYSRAVPCGLNVSCADHRPIPVEVKPGRTVNHIDPCDFYSEKSVPQP